MTKNDYKAGDVYARLMLTGKSYHNQHQHRRFVEVICECGVTKFVNFTHLKRGKIKSCGCLVVEVSKKLASNNIWFKTTHQLSSHPLFVVWLSMKDRCYRKNHKQRKCYGDVSVCDEWLNNFQAFYDWSMSNGWVYGLHLDKDKLAPTKVGKCYCPEYCCFITQKENNRNRRITKMVEYEGQNKSLGEWSDILKIKYATLAARLYIRNWSINKAFKSPVSYQKSITSD